MTDQPEPDRYQEHLDAFGASLRKASLEHRALRPVVGRRPLLVVAGLVAAIAITLGVAIDRGQPGTFVGEAGARELLRAAADATRGDELPTGWRWSRTTSVERMVLEGRRCATCDRERGVLEYAHTQDVWTGPGGEAYWSTAGGSGRAVENEPLLRAAGAVGAPEVSSVPQGMHVPVATTRDDSTSSVGLGMPGAIADPTAVPADPSGLVRWVRRQIRAQERAWEQQSRGGQGRMRSMVTGDERVAYALVDLATSPQLAGRQQAAAFEALATLADVTVSRVPAAFAAPNRVAVRIVGGDADRQTSPIPRPDRIVVFDRDSFRVVGEQMDDRDREPRATMMYGSGKNGGRLKKLAGGSGERRFGAPVTVPAPGVDDTGRTLMDVTTAYELRRDGRAQPKKVSKIK